MSLGLTAESAARSQIPGRWELVQGGVSRMSPVGALHGLVVSAAAAKLRRFVRPRRLGVVLAGDAGFVLRRRPDTVRAPDVAFVCRARIPNPPPDTFIEGAPDLAVEVLSPQDRAAAAARKAAEYLRAGTRLVWVIDPAGGPAAGPSARVYTRRGVRTISRDGVLTGGRVLPGFRVRLSDLIA